MDRIQKYQRISYMMMIVCVAMLLSTLVYEKTKGTLTANQERGVKKMYSTAGGTLVIAVIAFIVFAAIELKSYND